MYIRGGKKTLVHDDSRVGAVQLTVIEMLVLLTSMGRGRCRLSSRWGERQSWAVKVHVCMKMGGGRREVGVGGTFPEWQSEYLLWL